MTVSENITPTTFTARLQRVQERLQNRAWWVDVVTFFVITRLILAVGGYAAALAFPDDTGPLAIHVAQDNLWIDMTARWDSIAYLDIADRGYLPNKLLAYFPVYPLLINLVTTVTGSSLVSGILISNVMLLGALLILYKLVELEFADHAAGLRTVFYIAAFPTAFFFSAVYTESTFFFFTIAAMYAARRQQWVAAAALSIIGGATRSIGGIMVVVVGLEWLKFHGWLPSTMFKAQAWRNLATAIRRDFKNLAVISCIPLGLVSFMLFCQLNFGSPIAFITAQQQHFSKSAPNPTAIVSSSLNRIATSNFLSGADFPWLHTINLITGAAFLLLSIPIGLRLGASYAVFNAVQVVFSIAFSANGIIRYVLISFPVFMLLGLWGKNALLDRVLLIAFSLFLGIFTAVFVNWYFIA